jgi:hypothetical protein
MPQYVGGTLNIMASSNTRTAPVTLTARVFIADDDPTSRMVLLTASALAPDTTATEP